MFLFYYFLTFGISSLVQRIVFLGFQRHETQIIGLWKKEIRRRNILIGNYFYYSLSSSIGNCFILDFILFHWIFRSNFIRSSATCGSLVDLFSGLHHLLPAICDETFVSDCLLWSSSIIGWLLHWFCQPVSLEEGRNKKRKTYNSKIYL